jgi:hypothetical protein
MVLYAVVIGCAMWKAWSRRCGPTRPQENEIYSEEALLRDLTPDSSSALEHDEHEEGSLSGLAYSMSPHRKVYSWCEYIDKHCCSERLWCVAKWVLWLVVTVLAVIGIGACLLYPQPPQYSVCNQQMNWKSVFQGMRQLGVRGDVTLLLSFYNPNRLAAHVTSAVSTFTWGNDYVGRWELETDLVLVASEGDVVDYQVTNW